MNRCQLLLAKLAEEGSEISQIALKTQQFGMDEICPGQPLTNAQRIHLELDDLMAAIQMLNDEYGLMYLPNKERISAKIDKVNRYAQYSIQLGEVIS